MTRTKKQRLLATLMTAVLAGPLVVGTGTALADQAASTNPAEAADITNWIANSPQQISNNMVMQHINTNDLNGTRYVIQWGDTLSGISLATGISIAKLCYDNHIQNANLIYAGDVLILNRDGGVPAGYVIPGNPNAVARTRVTINNGPTNVHVTVKPTTVIKHESNQSTNQTKNIYQATTNDQAASSSDQTAAGSDQQAASNGAKGTKSKHASATNRKATKKHAVTADDVVSGLEQAAGSDSKLSFATGDGGADAKAVSVDGQALMKAAKHGDYDAVLSQIKAALGDDADQKTTVYIAKDGNQLSVYAQTAKDSDSSSSSDRDQDSASAKDHEQSDSSDDQSSSQSDQDHASQATDASQADATSDDN